MTRSEFLRALTAATAAGRLFGQEKKAPGEQRKPIPYTHQPDYPNVAYGPHERNVVDIWTAKSGAPTPLAIYYHPGGFSLGDKTWIPVPFLEAALKAGISVATANYRYSFQAHYPAPFEDCVRALQFLRLNAGDYHIDPKRVTMQGASAGGIVSMWIGFRDDMADPHSDDPVKRQSTKLPVIGAVDGQCTLDPRLIAKICDEQTARIMSRLALWELFGYGKDDDPFHQDRLFPQFEDTSAIHFLRPGAPPAFLHYHAALRPLDQADQSERVHNIRHGLAVKAKMDQLGIECVVSDPTQYSGNLAAQLNREMVNFFLKHF